MREDIEKRLPDFSKYVDPQKAPAEAAGCGGSEKGLPVELVEWVVGWLELGTVDLLYFFGGEGVRSWWCLLFWYYLCF